MSKSSSPRGAILEAIEELRNERPDEGDYAKIGRIALSHTALEYQFETLVWAYMKDVDLGHIATSNLGVKEIEARLSTLVEWTEPDDFVADEIKWSLKAFDILRLNRNAIIHGFNFKADKKSGQLFLERRSNSVVFDSFMQYAFDATTLQQVVWDQERIADHLFFISRHIDRRGLDAIGPGLPPPSEPAALRPRPPLPHALAPLPREGPISTRRQRQASLEKAAKLEKNHVKDRQRAHAKERAAKRN